MASVFEGSSAAEEARFVTVKMNDGSLKKLAVDEDGFIQDSAEWCQEFVAAVAPEEGISTVTDEHWRVINYLRDYYLRFNSCPPIKMLCKSVDFDIKKIYDLFPTGPAKGACRLAGAPKPTGCV